MDIYLRIYKGNAYTPTRFYDVGWCRPSELEQLVKDGWLVDFKGFFANDGHFPRPQPEGIVCLN